MSDSNERSDLQSCDAVVGFPASVSKAEAGSETTPLLGASDRSLNQSWNIHRQIGRFIQKAEHITFGLKSVFNLVLADLFVLCVLLLVCKFASRQFWLHWRPLRLTIAPMGNWNLQVADCMLVLSYAMSDFLLLRVCLAIACLCFIVYAITSPIGVMPDMLFFNMVMLLLNVRHACALLYEMRHVEFNAEHEQAYSEVFKEFMKRTDYMALVANGLVRFEKAGVVLKQEGDLVTSLCLISSGTVAVLKEKRRVNRYGPNELLEAPEWVESDLSPDGIRFEASFVAETDCVYLKWPREKLVELLREQPQLKAGLRAVLGLQTAKLWLRHLAHGPRRDLPEH
eukprot:TRINITY_DN6426_c0_g1_i1.p1 TRINITY_DN6426_c0_g1~~TRINITY_DN6426_c0_g1_i1.p1  ORF type:complete len:358 (+),score=128.52 TRINITY_DN6426_c0_g1_i1:55-1074(+)